MLDFGSPLSFEKIKLSLSHSGVALWKMTSLEKFEAVVSSIEICSLWWKINFVISYHCPVPYALEADFLAFVKM
jgi:uncharacterized membrane protein YpjA